jgi:hypothetical protein
MLNKLSDKTCYEASSIHVQIKVNLFFYTSNKELPTPCVLGPGTNTRQCDDDERSDLLPSQVAMQTI